MEHGGGEFEERTPPRILNFEILEREPASKLAAVPGETPMRERGRPPQVVRQALE
jgi:hypothetical protein